MIQTLSLTNYVTTWWWETAICSKIYCKENHFLPVGSVMGISRVEAAASTNSRREKSFHLQTKQRAYKLMVHRASSIESVLTVQGQLCWNTRLTHFHADSDLKPEVRAQHSNCSSAVVCCCLLEKVPTSRKLIKWVQCMYTFCLFFQTWVGELFRK